jgi:hypothetical protein
MLITLPVIITVAILKFVSIETPVPDNRRTLYCVADNNYQKGEHNVSAKKPCTKGSMSVNKELPSLAERKSK